MRRINVVFLIGIFLCTNVVSMQDEVITLHNRIAFFAARGLDEPGQGLPGDLVILDPRTRNSYTIEVGLVEPTTLRWSPDGRWLAFAAQNELDIINANGSGRRMVTAVMEHELVSWPRWSQDGRQIAYIVEDRSDHMYSATPFVVDVLDGASRQLVLEPLDVSTVDWSSDGQLIVFGGSTRISDATESRLSDIYLVDVENGEITNLTQSDDFDFLPAWSPDGSRIAFNSYRDDTIQVYVMAANGDDEEQVTFHDRIAILPRWVLGGGGLVYITYDESNRSHLYLLDLETGTTTSLVDRTTIGIFAISPDDQQVAHISREEPEPAVLCVIHLTEQSEWCSDIPAFESSGIAWGS